MEKVLKEIEEFKQEHPDIAKAMEIFQMSMKDYEQAYRFLHESRTYTSNTTFPPEAESD
jgi:hypothetical protein